MTTTTASINVNTTPVKANKLSSLISAIAYSLESYFGPWNIEVTNPEHRANLTREDKANVNATLNGIGTF